MGIFLFYEIRRCFLDPQLGFGNVNVVVKPENQEVIFFNEFCFFFIKSISGKRSGFFGMAVKKRFVGNDEIAVQSHIFAKLIEKTGHLNEWNLESPKVSGNFF